MRDMHRNRQLTDLAVRSKVYQKFGGVDLTTAVTEVDDRRSPYAPNMIVEQAGYPQKRTGYRRVSESFEGRINGLHLYVDEENVERMMVHAGTKLYMYDPDTGSRSLLFSGANDARSVSFMYGGAAYLLDGVNYLTYRDGAVVSVESVAYAPVTMIAGSPAGGGVPYDPLNLLSTKRVNQFIGTATATVYQLDATGISGVVSCEKLASNGTTWSVISSGSYSVNTSSGSVTFATAPGAPPSGAQVDNIRITFTKAAAGNAEKIKNCTVTTQYGMGNDIRVFVSGNSDRKYRNYDFYSGYGRADYFPDLNYCIVGTGGSEVMGYLAQYDELAIVKRQSGKDVNIYFRSATLDEDGEVVFVTRQGLSGTGAASRFCFATLGDDPVFLSPDGVYGLDTSQATMQRITRSRSYYVNGSLTKEPQLDDAVSCVLDNRYYLFINGRVYVADGGQKNSSGDSYGYEWYYWTNVPARSVCACDGKLYFGSEEGRLYCFKDERADGVGAYSDDGSPIYAAWATRMDNLGDSSRYKFIRKGGTGVMVMPSVKTSGTIRYVTDKGEQNVRGYGMSTIFDFDAIDFDNFDFGSLPYPTFVPARRKKRKVRMLQIMLENDKADESFGVHEIRVDFVAGRQIRTNYEKGDQ